MLFSIAIDCIRFSIHYENKFQTSNHVFHINSFDNERNVKAREITNKVQNMRALCFDN